jgi:Ca2+-binding RTX toxin-like protein
VEVNQSSPSIYGLPLFPVVDFASTYQSERKALFDLLKGGDNSSSGAELNAAFGAGFGSVPVTTVDQLIALLDTGSEGPAGVLYLDEVIDQLNSALSPAELQTLTDQILALDADSDGKFDPAGYEVNTGGTPVYLAMDSPLIRAQGFVELNLFDIVYVSGSVAFELGPTHDVTLSDGISTKTVSTMTIGAADVTAFIGFNGPYWTDNDGNHEVTRTPGVPDDGNGRIDADESLELNDDAAGFEITDLDIGVIVMASLDPLDLGVYLAAKLSVNSFGLVGIPGLTATGAFDVALNVGISLAGLDSNLEVIDFPTSFSEAPALFDLLDTTPDGVISQAEQIAAFEAGYSGSGITSVAQLVTLLNTDAGPPDAYLEMNEVLDKLSDSFKNSHQSAIAVLDVDENGRLNTGFEVNTGNPDAPVVLDFDQFLIRIQLGGEVELANVFHMSGLFLFEVDSNGLKAFLAASLEIGPDIGSSSKIFNMNALGALVINSDGIAADIDVSVSVGGALSSVLQLNASARMVFNTTGEEQFITIPMKYVGYLNGTADLSALDNSGLIDPSQFSSLTGPLDSRFVPQPDGSVKFTINAGAPRIGGGFEAPGPYFLISLHGDLTIVSTFKITADFRLKVSTLGLELGFNGSIDLGGFASVHVEGGAVIESGVFAAYVDLNVDINVVGIHITGGAVLEINSGSGSKTVYDALGNPHPINGTTFKVSVDATLDLFGVLTATAEVVIGVEDGVFSISVDGSIGFFGIVDVDISGYFSIASNGDIKFSFTGSLVLDLTVGEDLSEFGITGSLSVTIKDSGFSGHGSVGLVVLGEDINIASADVSVDWDAGTFFIRAEGPLSVWLEVSGNRTSWSITGGLGVFDAIFEALGDAAEAIGDAVVAAAEAVADALEDLGQAILDFGEDVLDFVDGILTDIGELVEDIIGAIGGLFESSKTEVVAVPVNADNEYSYSAIKSGTTLTITNRDATQIALAVVSGQVVVDAPDVTRNVVVARENHYSRHWIWSWTYVGWSDWHLDSSSPITKPITFSNTKSFAAGSVFKIVINGTNSPETIVMDRASIFIDTDVHGNGGNDVIVTGQGDDHVWGGNGDDTIFTNEGDDFLYGEGNNDKLMGGAGVDYLDGGAGNDLLDENQGIAHPETETLETNTLIGGDGVDIILGSPGKDTIEGGTGNDVLTGLSNDDTYVFNNNYGTDQFADYYGKETLDFSGATNAVVISMSETGFTASAGTGNFLSVDSLVWIALIKTGQGADYVAITALPNHQINIVDAGGSDIYDLDFDQADAAQSIARVDIVDNSVGGVDRIDLDLDSTGFDVYLHPQAVLLNHLLVSFSTGVELLILTDHAAQTTVTTQPVSGPTTLLVKSGVTITSALGGQIELLARLHFTLQAGAFVLTAGNVIIRGDDDDVDSTGSTISLFGTINADTVTVYGKDDNDTVNVGNVTAGSQTTIRTFEGSDTVNIQTINAETTVYAGTENDTINVGSAAPATGGTLDGISAVLNVYGEGGSNSLNVYDNGDASANTGTLTSTTITGLDMAGSVLYDAIATLTIGLGTAGDVFTIQNTHLGVTTVNANGGGDTVNVRTIAGVTTVNGGDGSDTINVGSLASVTGGTVDGIGALLTINGNDPTSGSDVLNVDDTGDSSANTGTLTSTTITGLGMGGSITYGTIEHLTISLGSGGNTFTVNSTHGSATFGFQEDTTVNTGSAADTVHINDVTDLLVVNGQSGVDTVDVNGTGSGSISTLNGDSGNDIFNVRAMNGTVNVNGGDNDDSVHVGSDAPLLPSLPTDMVGTIDNINGLLTVSGGNGTDVMNVDDSDPSVTNKTGTLTSTSIRGLAMEQGIDYAGLENLNIWLAIGDNTLIITSTHSGQTTVNTALGNDTVNVNGDSGTVTINAEAGNDIINVRAISGATTVNAGDGADTVNVGSNASGTVGNPNNNSGGTVDSIGSLLTVNGDGEADVMNVDDATDGNANTGTLTSTTITGLDMAGSITYLTIETLNIGLGTAGDVFTIESTHAGVTNVNANGGGDTVNVRTIAGVTTVNGGDGSDTVNVGSLAPGAGGTVNGIGALLTINGNDPASGSDVLNVDDTGDSSANTGTLTSTTITGLGMGGSITYGTVEHLTISLGSGGNTFTINSTHGSATFGFQEDTIVNTGTGADTVHINDVTDLLVVNGQAGGDTMNVNGTGTGSVSTLNGDGGNDIFNVRAMNGTVNVNGGDNDDNVHVGSDTPLLPSVPTSMVGTIDNINGLLTVTGGNGSDVMNVDDSDPAVANKTGTLTSTTIRGLALEQGIDYSGLEHLNIWLAIGDNTLIISSTHAGQTTINTALGNDTINVDGASGTLTINAEIGNDTVNVRATGMNSQAFINGQEGDDTFNLSDHSPSLPDAYPTVQTPPAADTEGNIDAINGLIVINGGSNIDVINIDDSRNIANKAGTLMATTLRGLEMEAGVNYSNAEDFNLWLGTGTDGLFIDSTHAGTTDIYTGDGNSTVNQRDDTIAIRSISGVTTVHGQGGNDFFYANVSAPSPNEPGFFAQFKAAAAATAGESLFNALFTRTHANGLGAVLNLHGDGDSDQYTLNFAGQGDALVNVHDNGAPDNGVDTLIVNGADVVAGLDNHPNDTFLLRRTFVVLLNDSDGNGAFDKVERVNYDENINARLIVNGLGGNDKFVADDNSSITTLDGGDGDDTFQIGQVFGTLRDASAGIAAGDEFETTPIIIGVITDPVTGVVIFDPTSFDPVSGVLTSETLAAINAAITHQRALGLALNGVAYVSSGVSHPTTVLGGKGADTFNVYHNVGTLRLDGEADNDTFTVRAFVTLDLSPQGTTEVNGGDGTDTINYAINAPVNIDGGSGFDRVVVLGTPFNDSFVVTSEGIFGAGLNVKFTNVESAELDALEGNDTIYVLGTSADIVTTVIAGLGDDTINVMGDVMNPIVSYGRTGGITHGLTSGDSDYNQVGVNGVPVSVLSAANDSLVNITPTGEPLVVTEEGAIAHYFISLVSPDAASLGLKPVYLTVSAGVTSYSDRSIGGAGILVRVNGGVFTNAVVLTFNAATANTVFHIDVMAINDNAAEGPRVALISHSIISDNPAYDGFPILDVFVNVVDNDQRGLDIRHLSLEGGVYGDNSTQVLENGFGDIYSVSLTSAPAVGETVTVTLQTDAQITARSLVGNLGFLTFNNSNWMTPQIVSVLAVNDPLDGIEISVIKHVITTSGGAVYAGYTSDTAPKFSVTVYDDDTPGAIVQQSDGSTSVVLGGATDSYRVRLTGAPDSNVTLTLRTDMQTLLSGAGLVAVDVTGTLGYFEYRYTFTTGNWNQWANIIVSANSAFSAPNESLMAFPPQDQNLDQIRGPLIIEGGVGPGVIRSLAAPVMLPGETNQVSVSDFGDPNSASALESNDIDVLNVFHTDNSDSDSGRMFYRTVDAAGHTVRNAGLALTGFEMGGDKSVDEGTSIAPSIIYYGGGITYNGFEIVEVLLGKGSESLTINDTGDRDESNPAVTVDHATITSIHGGGGDDTITITNRGEGPLVVYGDTSEDGVRYSNNQPSASIHGTSFGNPGNDTIDASAMLEQGDSFVGVVIYGGAGNDSITGSQDDDHLAGGTGGDTISAQGGNDHLYGDSSFNVNLSLFAQDQVTPFDAGIPLELAKINSMFTVPVTAIAGEDVLYGDAGDDVIFGDHGVIDQVIGTRRIKTTGAVTFITTTQPSNGVPDTIYGGGDNDIILGGNGGDTIAAGQGGNIVLGDFGYIDYVGVDANPADIDLIISTETTILGGADNITAGSGQDVILGGRFGDTINAGNGDNLVIGDSGRITSATTGVAQLSGVPMTLGVIETTEYADGGSDTITTGSGKDIILGGADGDDIRAGDNNDLVHGDNALISYVVDGIALTLDLIDPLANSVGGVDTIRGEGGEDVLIGGAYGDRIDGGSERDLIFGDNARLDRTAGDGFADARYRTVDGTEGGQLYSTASGTDGLALLTPDSRNIPGGAPVWEDFNIQILDHDTATEAAAGTNFGIDYIAGGAQGDQIFGELGNDTIQGDGSIDLIVGAQRLGDGTLSVSPSVESATDGDDYIEGNGGNDVIFGNLGQDDIIGGSSDLFSLSTRDRRPDGSDFIFGGAGTELSREELLNIIDEGDTSHARDSDSIAGDNADIYRLVGAGNVYLQFNYDQNSVFETRGSLRIIPRAVSLLDYTPGGPDYTSPLESDPSDVAVNPTTGVRDSGVADEIHGESGDDFIYGMVGDDIIYGEGQDDDLIGGYGNDWISGGNGDDGILGDDGRILTSRNSLTEPLSGVLTGTVQQDISTPGKMQQATINVAGALKKAVNLTPFNEDPNTEGQNPLFRPIFADDIIYGGLGNDALHGGVGDDAISGAEALAESYIQTYTGILVSGTARSDYFHPYNPGDVLRYNTTATPAHFDPVRRADEFALYDEYNPLRQILLNADGTASDTFVGGVLTGKAWFLNFDKNDGVAMTSPSNGTVFSDGSDVIFGDLGNDWMVGGTGRDDIYGGWGNDLLNADDDMTTLGGAGTAPDTHPSYEDRAYGGAGRDVLIANTGGDRLIDWVGEFNSYLVPFAPFGAATVSRTLAPQLAEFLYALSKSQGADPTRVLDTGGDPARNGEPSGELGVIRQQDFAWQEQTGGPIDPQAGNVQGGPRDVLRAADFNNGTLQSFAVDSGTWQVSGGALQVSASSLGSDAAAVFAIPDYLPIYFEVQASISVIKPTAGWKGNAYIIFDYQGPTAFKFAGIDVSINKLVMGHRDATGWVIDQQTPFQAKPDTYYNMTLVVNGLTAMLIVDNQSVFAQTYAPRVVDGYTYGLNYGFIGFGSDNSRGSYDNIVVQVLPPNLTYDRTEDFDDGIANDLNGFQSGSFTVTGDHYDGAPSVAGGIAIDTIDLGIGRGLETGAYLDMSVTVRTATVAGLVFDGYSVNDAKFAVLDIPNQKVLVGHISKNGSWTTDASVSATLVANTNYVLSVILRGSTVSVSVNGSLVASTSFNSAVVDGAFGVITKGGTSTFDVLRTRTNDKAFLAAPPLVSIADVFVTEGNQPNTTNLTLTLTLSRAALGTTTVNWSTADGTAVSTGQGQSDYGATPGVVTFAPGVTTANIVVVINGDNSVESDEMFKIFLTNPAGLTFGDNVGLVTIVNDDVNSPPTVTVTATDAAGSEQGTEPIVFTVSRVGYVAGSSAVSLSWTGTATLNTDYIVSVTGATLSANNLILTFAAGSISAVITLTPVDDSPIESTEGVTMSLVAGTGYNVGTPSSAFGTITDNDTPAVSAGVTDAAGAEQGSNPIVFTVTRSGNVSASAVVNLVWSGTATLTTDYAVVASGATLSTNKLTLTFAAGASVATLTVTPVDDTALETNEGVTLTIAAGTGYTVGTPSASATITDNDTPLVSIAATDAAGAEQASNTIVFTLTRGGNSSTSITVNLGWSGTAVLTTDYAVSATGGTLASNRLSITLASGATSATITITPVNDVIAEGNEDVVLSIVTGSGYNVGASNIATGTITDNDVAPLMVDRTNEEPVTEAPLDGSTALPVLEAAMKLWKQAGADKASFSAVKVVVTDLPGALLGLTEGSTIYLDVDAAGFGWFVDETPGDSREFHSVDGVLTARRSSDALGRMDLLTVLSHELGHVLGLDHEAGGLMSETLAVGVRETVGKDAASLAYASPLDIGDFFNLDGNTAFAGSQQFRMMLRNLSGSQTFRRRGLRN